MSVDGDLPRLDDLIEAERDIMARLDAADVEVDFEALSLVSNVYRAAAAIRRHMEQQVLTPTGLSWTAFVILWVLWIWGRMETRHLAVEAGVTKATLTGVLDTLERRGLLERQRSTTDRRRVTVALTASGERTIRDTFPAFNAEEAGIAALVDPTRRAAVTAGLREIVRGMGGLDEGGPAGA